MDEKQTQETKPKITRSRARHLRRKRLIIARKAAGSNSNIEIDVRNSNLEETKSHNQHNTAAEELSKSKVRRLKKKNRKHTCTSPSTLDNYPINSTNSVSYSLSENIQKNPTELIENAKNLEINEHVYPSSSRNFIESPTSNDIARQLIIKDSKVITKLTDSWSNNASDDVSRTTLSHASATVTEISSIKSVLNPQESKMNNEVKSREQIKAEREAKKAAKAATKIKVKSNEPLKVETKKQETAINCVPIKKEVDALANSLSQTTITDSSKSKAELRAERRAKQEAQRAAKVGAQQIKEKPKADTAKLSKSSGKVHESPEKSEDPSKKAVMKILLPKNAHEISFFKHLYHEREQAFLQLPAVNSRIHPAIVRLGAQYASKIVVGSNARCIALLAAVKQLIGDFERPAHADFTRGLETSLQEASAYLHHCRPLAVSMQNALRHIKRQMTQLKNTVSDDEAKSKLRAAIDTYIQEQILLADKAISITIQTKISNGDVILTYGYSSLIQNILCDAHDAGRQFRVVVVDGRPWLEGRELIRRLAKHGVECSYVLINALSFIMPEVSKVFLGAHAILANGAVMGRAGTAQVALMAKAFNVPVLVACETHKSSERVQTDSIVYNEIGNADELTENVVGNNGKTLTNWRAKKSLNLLNITYDVTPADLVTAVVTELAILPCTSVPVILRIKPSEI